MIGSSPRASFWLNVHIRAQCPAFGSKSMAPGPKLVQSTFSTIIVVMARTASSSSCLRTCLSTSWECPYTLTITLCMTRKPEPLAGFPTPTRPSQTSWGRASPTDQIFWLLVRFNNHHSKMYLLRMLSMPLSPSLSSLPGRSGSTPTSRMTYWKILQLGNYRPPLAHTSFFVRCSIGSL